MEQVLQHGQASQSSGLLPSFCASQAQDKRPPADPPTRPLFGRIKEGPPQDCAALAEESLAR